jgi:putative membrane protein
MRTSKDYIILYLKGLAMGAADVIPGVSGGTIAFISGIYEELLNSIRSFNGSAIALLFKADIKGFWQHVNGIFLVVLLSGIATSFLSFSKLMLYWMEYYPEMLWAFFFGLVLASAVLVSKKISRWNMPVIIGGFLGIFFGYYITVATPTQTTTALWFIFLSGSIAICAMILPGISGSFILLLMGKYEYMMTALINFKLAVIITFISGAVVGLLSFSHLLNWMLKRFHDLTVAMLTGLMVGSLNKVWPWKKAVETYTNHKGQIVPLIEQNILPNIYFEVTGKEPYLMYAVALALAGFALVYILEKMSSEKN